MEDKEIEKNRLELAYQRYLQLLNTLFIVGGGTIIGALVNIVFFPEKWFEGSIIFITIGLCTYLGYYKLNRIFKNISTEIKNLKGV